MGLDRPLVWCAPVLLAVSLAAGGYWLAAGRYGTELETLTAEHEREIGALRADLEAKRADAERQARETEARWRAQIDVQAAQRDAVAAAAVSDSLRERASQLARACSGGATGATAARGGQAASSPGALLADVFARADAAAGDLARIADERGAAGAACERAAGAVRR
jgi:hypothetical protein